MCIYKYLVRLTPIDTYFFGGETTFGNNTKQNYYVKSNKLPQVSTLLGTMRYEILRQRDLLFPLKEGRTKREVVDAIGEKGFDMSPNHYGIIKEISPLFIENKNAGAFYTSLPLDYGIKVHKTNIKCSFSSTTTCEYAYAAEGYDMKKYDNYRYWTDNKKNKVDDGDIFYQKEQVGITKNGKSDDDKDAYYKIITYGLRSGYNFIFMLTTSEELKESDTITYMGGNRSAFKMQVSEISGEDKEKIGDSFTEYFSSLHEDGRFLLLGDAFFSDEEIDRLPFFWAESICNRYVVTKQNVSGVSWKEPDKTKALYRLLKRGGVIYSDEKLQCEDYLTNVGLNIFI